MRVKRAGSIQHVRAPMASEMTVLIQDGLTRPSGIAVDQLRSRLVVSDPGSRKILSFPLTSNGDNLYVGGQMLVADDVEADWVAVDDLGNIFAADSARNKIVKYNLEQGASDNQTEDVVFDSASLSQVSSPGGLAVDPFHAYWVNQQKGLQAGSLVKAFNWKSRSSTAESQDLMSPDLANAVSLAQNADQSVGVCVALGNLFYTQSKSVIYGVKKIGGSPVTITDRLKTPRGCAWDGDSTVYVADRSANSIYSFSSSMQELSAVQLSKTVDYQDAFGLAVFSASPRSQQPLLLSSLSALLLLLLLQH